jgi:hypothetical protein
MKRKQEKRPMLESDNPESMDGVRHHDFIQETSWIMCGFGVDGGHVVGILESR